MKKDEIHVWQIDCDPPYDWLKKLRELLTDEEEKRADRFHFEKDRNTYIASRAGARILLGEYTGRTPSEIEFGYGEKGKPFLSRQDGDPDVTFNSTHSGACVLLAFSLARRVGIDVEWRGRKVTDRDGLVERFFSRAENRQYSKIEDKLREEAFFNGWTRKEAFVKAIGSGLWIGLESFDVTIHPADKAAITEIRHPGEDAAEWKCVSWEPRTDYTASVAADRPDWTMIDRGTWCP